MIDGRGYDIIHYTHDAGNGFYYTGSTEAVTGHRFGGTDIRSKCIFSKYIHNGFHFRYISEWSGCSMRVDIIYIGSCQTRVPQGGVHNILCTSSFRMWRRDMVSVACSASASYLTINSGTSPLCMFKFFKNQGSCSLSDHKSIPALVIRTTGSFRTVISFTERLHGIKTTHAGFCNDAFRATGQDDVGHTK